MLDNPENFESYLLDELIKNKNFFKKSEMSDGDRQLLNGIIRESKPKKILEIGVSAGCSSAIILNAIKDIKDAKLYSIDYRDTYFQDQSKKIGYIVEEEFPNLINNNWKLYTGATSARFMEDILLMLIQESY